jgi:hypothetical protein
VQELRIENSNLQREAQHRQHMDHELQARHALYSVTQSAALRCAMCSDVMVSVCICPVNQSLSSAALGGAV